MGKLTEPSQKHRLNGNEQFARLRERRRRLAAEIARLDSQLSKLPSPGLRHKVVSLSHIDHWLDDLTRGLPDLPPLPADLSRADLYDDHD